MMIYFVILLFLLFGVFHYDYLKNSYGKNGYIILVFILLGLMSAFRYRVGGDSIVYEEVFPYMPTLGELKNYILNENNRGFQPLWLFLNAIVRSLGGDVYDFQFLHAIIFNSCLYVFLKRYTKYQLSFLLIFYIFSLYFYYSFEIQRESLAIAIFLVNIKNLDKQNWKMYYFLATISFLFHVSAIVIFFFPLFRFIKINKKLIIILVIIGIPLTLLKDLFVNLFSSLIFLDSMKSRADIYSQGGFSFIGILSFYFVRVILPMPFIFILSKKVSVAKNGMLIIFVILSVFAQIIVGFERFLNYIYIWIIVQFINERYSKKIIFFSVVKQYAFKVSFCLMLFFIISYKYILVDKNGNHYYSIFFPYENKFDKQVNAERENYILNLWNW